MWAGQSESNDPVKALRKLKGYNPKLFNGGNYFYVHSVYPKVDGLYHPVGFVGCYNEKYEEVI